MPATTYYETTLGARDAAPHAPLAGTAQADTVIVGGGFAGLATAYGLMDRGNARGCVLLEAQRVGHGASGRNGGFVFGGFSRDGAKLADEVGRDEARRLYRGTLDAVARIRGRIERHAIACDPVDSGVLLANWFADSRVLQRVQRLMRDTFEVEWRWLSRDEVRERLRTPRYHAALHETHAFHFHPLKYARGLARVLRDGGVQVHEHSPVTAIERDGAGWRVRVASGHGAGGPHATVRCREVVVCGGGYLGRLVPALARATMPIATYVMVTEPLGTRLRDAICTDAAVYDTRFAFDYYRPLPDTRLLWGGRISIAHRSADAVKRLLTRDLLTVYPQLRGVAIEHAWSGWMSYARHQMPQIGRLPSGLWFATGFGGHGVAPTTLAGELLAKALTGEAPIPRGLAHYGLPPTWGPTGRLAAQATYWWLQAMDTLRERRG